jgi:hypothetical protein
MDIKCWNTRLNARDLRIFTAIVHTITVIGSKQSKKKGKDETEISPNLVVI